MASSTLCLRLAEEENITMTHIKMARVEVETDRLVELPDGTLQTKPGMLNIWFAKCRKSQSGNWIEDPVPGINVRLTGAAWEALKSQDLGQIRTIEEVETVIYGLCAQLGFLPEGRLEPYES